MTEKEMDDTPRTTVEGFLDMLEARLVEVESAIISGRYVVAAYEKLHGSLIEAIRAETSLLDGGVGRGRNVPKRVLEPALVSNNIAPDRVADSPIAAETTDVDWDRAIAVCAEEIKSGPERIEDLFLHLVCENVIPSEDPERLSDFRRRFEDEAGKRWNRIPGGWWVAMGVDVLPDAPKLRREDDPEPDKDEVAEEGKETAPAWSSADWDDVAIQVAERLRKGGPCFVEGIADWLSGDGIVAGPNEGEAGWQDFLERVGVMMLEGDGKAWRSVARRWYALANDPVPAVPARPTVTPLSVSKPAPPPPPRSVIVDIMLDPAMTIHESVDRVLSSLPPGRSLSPVEIAAAIVAAGRPIKAASPAMSVSAAISTHAASYGWERPFKGLWRKAAVDRGIPVPEPSPAPVAVPAPPAPAFTPPLEPSKPEDAAEDEGEGEEEGETDLAADIIDDGAILPSGSNGADGSDLDPGEPVDDRSGDGDAVPEDTSKWGPGIPDGARAAAGWWAERIMHPPSRKLTPEEAKSTSIDAAKVRGRRMRAVDVHERIADGRMRLFRQALEAWLDAALRKSGGKVGIKTGGEKDPPPAGLRLAAVSAGIPVRTGMFAWDVTMLVQHHDAIVQEFDQPEERLILGD